MKEVKTEKDYYDLTFAEQWLFLGSCERAQYERVFPDGDFDKIVLPNIDCKGLIANDQLK